MKLGRYRRPRVLDGAREFLHAAQAGVVVKLKLSGEALPQGVNRAHLGDDQTHSSFRPPPQIGQEPVAHFALLGPVTGAHGRHHRARFFSARPPMRTGRKRSFMLQPPRMHKTPAALAAQPARRHHSPEQGRRSEPGISRFVAQEFTGFEHLIQPHGVGNF